jgi:hypothetical protein
MSHASPINGGRLSDYKPPLKRVANVETAAVSTRKRILDMVTLAAGFHMPYPGIAIVEKSASRISNLGSRDARPMLS